MFSKSQVGEVPSSPRNRSIKAYYYSHFFIKKTQSIFGVLSSVIRFISKKVMKMLETPQSPHNYSVSKLFKPKR